MILVLVLINNWEKTFPQAATKTDIYMKPPTGPSDFMITDLPKFIDRFTDVKKLTKTLYGLKDTGSNWHQFLRAGLLDCNWKQSKIDDCLFTKG